MKRPSIRSSRGWSTEASLQHKPTSTLITVSQHRWLALKKAQSFIENDEQRLRLLDIINKFLVPYSRSNWLRYRSRLWIRELAPFQREAVGFYQKRRHLRRLGQNSVLLFYTSPMSMPRRSLESTAHLYLQTDRRWNQHNSHLFLCKYRLQRHDNGQCHLPLHPRKSSGRRGSERQRPHSSPFQFAPVFPADEETFTCKEPDNVDRLGSTESHRHRRIPRRQFEQYIGHRRQRTPRFAFTFIPTQIVRIIFKFRFNCSEVKLCERLLI